MILKDYEITIAAQNSLEFIEDFLVNIYIEEDDLLDVLFTYFSHFQKTMDITQVHIMIILIP